MTDRIAKLLDSYPSDAHAYLTYEFSPSGKRRPITKPNKTLRRWLRATNRVLVEATGDWPPYMHGGIKRRSYVSHARPHINKQCVITLDIKECFTSISTRDVASVLKRHLKLTDELSQLLAGRLCFKGVLPQGFPTSNYVCNLHLLEPLENIHTSLAVQGLTITNYVDDIAISGVISGRMAADVINTVAVALSGARLTMSKPKVKVMRSSQPQIVCGLLVNKRLALTREKRKELIHDITHGNITVESLEGWLLNLHNVNPTFSSKLRRYALKVGLLRATDES